MTPDDLLRRRDLLASYAGPWQGVVHRLRGVAVIPGVLLWGTAATGLDAERLPPRVRDLLLPQMEGCVVHWTHKMPRGSPLGRAACVRREGANVRGALLLDETHPMAEGVCQAALRRPGSMCMSVLCYKELEERGPGNWVLVSAELYSIDVVVRGATTHTLLG